MMFGQILDSLLIEVYRREHQASQLDNEEALAGTFQ